MQVAEPVTIQGEVQAEPGRPNSGFESRDRSPLPADLLPPRGALLSRVEASRTPETVARHIEQFGVDAVRWMQKRQFI